MTDIKRRLRVTQDDWPAYLIKLELEAADEIQRLEDELYEAESLMCDPRCAAPQFEAELREAKKRIAKLERALWRTAELLEISGGYISENCEYAEFYYDDSMCDGVGHGIDCENAVTRARAALENTDD